MLFLQLTSSICAQEFFRYSNNLPLPELNVIGVILSENLESGNTVVNEILKGQMELPIDYPIFIDPTYKQLKESSGFDISLFGKSMSGKKYESKVDSELELNANTFSFIVTDRKKKVRAFSQVFNLQPDNFARLIEELLLNLDGEEAITIDSESPDEASGWQTSLGKENEAKNSKNTLVIDFGASKLKWYKFLGEELPDVNFLSQDGSQKSLYEQIDGKVSLIAVFAGSSDPNNMVVMPGLAMQLSLVYQLYYSFTLGHAAPGDVHETRATGF